MTIERVEHALFDQISYDAPAPQTLAWQDDEVVDYAGGHARYSLDGRHQRGGYTSYGPFDGATASDDGRFVAIYQRLGTKALLFDRGKMIRELDRSYYCAEAYEYPVGFVRLPDGRTGLVHCPTAYNRLEIDDAATGERLTASDAREPADCFHSRPAGSPSGKRLVTAGWYWHPWDAIVLYDVAAALADPRVLDRLEGLEHSAHVGLTEETAAVWLDDDRIVVAGGPDEEDPEEKAALGDTPRLRPHGIAVFDLPSGRCKSSIVLPELPGGLMIAGAGRVVALRGEPRLVDLATGEELYRWRGVDGGAQVGPICWHLPPIPPIALDPARRRFAIASGGRITIVQLRGDVREGWRPGAGP